MLGLAWKRVGGLAAVAWGTGDKAGEICWGKRNKIRYPNIGGEEPKQEQVPEISRRRIEERLKNGGFLKIEERSSSEQ